MNFLDLHRAAVSDWDDLFSHVCACTGWTWDQAGDLTLLRLKALQRYWRKHPPVHLLVAAYLGYKPRDEERQGDLGELFTMMTGQAAPG